MLPRRRSWRRKWSCHGRPLGRPTPPHRRTTPLPERPCRARWHSRLQALSPSWSQNPQEATAARKYGKSIKSVGVDTWGVASHVLLSKIPTNSSRSHFIIVTPTTASWLVHFAAFHAKKSSLPPACSSWRSTTRSIARLAEK